MPNFFPTKYMFAAVPKNLHNNKTLAYLHIKTRPPMIWFIAMMRQTLKSTQAKQIFSILYHINFPSKRLLEQMNLIKANVVLVFVLLSYLPCKQFHGANG